MDYTDSPPPTAESQAKKLKLKARLFKQESHELEYKDRLNINVMVVHEHWGDRPVSHECHHAYFLDTALQPIPPRRMVIPSDNWVGLDFAWLEPKDIGLIVLENLAGKGRKTNPTEEEIIQTKDQLVFVRVRHDGGNLILRPGIGYPLEFEDIEEVVLRAKTIPTQVSVSIYPR